MQAQFYGPAALKELTSNGCTRPGPAYERSEHGHRDYRSWGASTIPSDEEPAYRAGCRRAVEAGWSVLERGGSALDAIESAIRVLEDDETFNAGRGGALNAAGEVELCAGVMEGEQLHFGAITVAQGLPHPISVARALMERQETRLLAGRGAEQFAASVGAERCEPAALITAKQLQAWQEHKAQRREAESSHDTVGCVALDSQGRIAVGTSTGGEVGLPVGRVGDSPLPGCGFYAEAGIGGCSSTGNGEQLMQVVLAKTAVELLSAGLSADEAAEAAIETLGERVDGEGGCIVLDRDGGVGWAHNSSHMACAFRTASMDGPAIFTKKPQ
jgi:beta-aspartyl-peptidase (threonine type)